MNLQWGRSPSSRFSFPIVFTEIYVVIYEPRSTGTSTFHNSVARQGFNYLSTSEIGFWMFGGLGAGEALDQQCYSVIGH